jgi:CBS domain-containing protein
MKVEQCMTSPARTCAAGDRLAEAAEIMWQSDCGCVPVVDGDRRLVGVVTDRDICMAAYTRGVSLHDLDVAGAMARVVYACRPGEELEEAEKLMRSYQIRRLPVVDDDGRIVGVLSLSDIVRCASSALGEGRARPTRREADGERLVTGLILTLGAVCAPRRAPSEDSAEPASAKNEPAPALRTKTVRPASAKTQRSSNARTSNARASNTRRSASSAKGRGRG